MSDLDLRGIEERAEAARHAGLAVSERGRDGVVWTLFTDTPFGNDRIASFANKDDARFHLTAREEVLDLLAALREARVLLAWSAGALATREAEAMLRLGPRELWALERRHIGIVAAHQEGEGMPEVTEAEIVGTPHTVGVLREVGRERQRQEAKWGEQNHAPAIWLMVLGEEVGEANEAALEYWANKRMGTQPHCEDPGMWLRHCRAELIQVAAVAVSMVESLDRNELAGVEGDHA